MAISSIEHRGYWYEIFDARGKKAKSVSDNIGELLGWSDRFFIVMKGYWYDTYDEQGKKIKSISTNIGNFVSICADQFIVRKGSWLDTYDMEYPRYRFYCTCRASRKLLGDKLPNHQLQTVAAYCGYDLTKHHHAMADAEACAAIAMKLIDF